MNSKIYSGNNTCKSTPRIKRDSTSVPLITLRGYALTHEEVTSLAKRASKELEKARRELALTK